MVYRIPYLGLCLMEKEGREGRGGGRREGREEGRKGGGKEGRSAMDIWDRYRGIEVCYVNPRLGR